MEMSSAMDVDGGLKSGVFRELRVSGQTRLQPEQS